MLVLPHVCFDTGKNDTLMLPLDTMRSHRMCENRQRELMASCVDGNVAWLSSGPLLCPGVLQSEILVVPLSL